MNTRPLRVLLDVNIWIANLISAEKGRSDTAVQQLISVIGSGEWGASGRRVQLVISHAMLDTIGIVLARRGAPPLKAEAYCAAIMDLMWFGPEQLDPYLLLGGREQLPMEDIEDAGVLATALASRTDLLVTDNLVDFETRDAVRMNTRTLGASSGRRQLRALRHHRGGADLIVAHPFDVIEWLRRGHDFEVGALWDRIQSGQV